MSNAKSKGRAFLSQGFIRAVVWFIAGVVIAVTGVYHHDVLFDKYLFAGTLFLTALTYAYKMQRNRATLQIFVSFFMAHICLWVIPEKSQALAFLIAGWAVLTLGVTLFTLKTADAKGRKDVFLQVALLVLLAVSVLITMHDPIMVIGLFGAFAVIHAVFSGIAAIDTHGAKSAKIDAATE